MRNFKKVLALVLALAMVLTTFGMTAVSAAQYGDTSGHWAESYIDTWSNYGVIQGDGGYFRPDDAITRAEVAQVTQNVISYVDTAENTFVDVSASDWFADAVLKLVAAGALTGNGDGTMTPNNFMTREEAMTMLARAYGLTVENSNAAITQYADYQSVSDYATGYVGTMTSNGFVGGYEDGTVRPQAYISRAEFVKLLDNMIKLYITAPGAYGPEYVSGLVMVKTGGVTINGVVAKGIVVSPQVSGDVTITGSQVSGNIVNLSTTANVTSNTGGVVNPNATENPGSLIFPGSNGSGGSGGSSGNRRPTATPRPTAAPTATTAPGATATPAVTGTPAPTPVADVYPKDGTYDATSTAAPEITTEITFKDSEDAVTVIRDTLTGVELVKDTDYTIVDNKITFTEEFLNSLYDGVHTIEIVTEKSEEGTAPVFELTVTGSTVATPTPAPTEEPVPSSEPSAAPSGEPVPTDEPTATPGEATAAPSDEPTATPGEATAAPSDEPTATPGEPTATPDNTAKWVAEEHAAEYSPEPVVNPAAIQIGAMSMLPLADTYNYNPDNKALVGASNPKNAIDEVPTTGSAFEFSATESGVAVIEAYFHGRADKELYFNIVKVAADGTVSNIENTVDFDEPKTIERTLNIAVGEKYYIFVTGGSKVGVVSAAFTPDGGVEGPTATPGEPTPEPTATNTPGPTRDPNLPEDKAWLYSDTDLRSIVLAAGDKGVFGPYDGLSGYGQWTEKGSGAKFVHNGKSYTFTSGFNAGSGSANRRSFYFTPEQACIVTVAYTAQKGRPLYIYQNGVLLASGEAGATDGYAAALEADIEDPTAGDVYIYGGSSDKQLYGIFVDYYDPNVITYRNLSGKVNYAGSADLSNVKLVFTDEKDGTRYETAMGTEYSVDLRQNRNYKISVEADGAVSETLALTLDTNSVAIKKMDLTFDLSLVDIAPTQVTGEVVVHDINNDDTTLDLSKVQLTFTATDDPTYTYTTGVTDNKINVTMMPNHEYAITATGIDGYTMSALSQSYVMAAGDTSPFKNILFCEDVTEVPFAATIEVGTDKAYATINDAITAVSKMTDRPANEAGRVTIVIDPGVYTEQVMVTPSYVTLKAADEANRPEVQWYYGIGYLYYSSDGGYYSEDYAVQKTTKNPVTRWGSACRITGQYVYVENIIFKNTFNCEVTEAELADGVAPAQNNEYSDTNNKPDRTVAGYDARSQSATERAAAIALDGGFTELYRCDFISSQDTFYTNKNAYVKECYIEGGTDFVYGGNAILFEDCTLAWHGYSDGAKGGYLTACKTSGAPSADTINTAGYKFVNTTVTNSKYYPDNKFHAGSWGRNWGGAACQVVFDGVTLDGVDTPGEWVKMGGELKDSVLYVNNVTDKNGADVNVSGTTFNPNGTMAANGYTTLADMEFFGGTWVPPHYSGDIQLTEYTTQWMFGKSNGAAEYALEGTDGTTEIVGTSNAPEEQVLGVDATNGKFNNATRTDEWAQVNTGTVFTVPVVNGSVITFGSYAAEILEANGTEFTKNDRFTYVGAGGTIDVTVLSGGYLSYIKVVSPVDPEEYDPTEYSITITEGYTNGTVEVSKTTAVAGETITLTATPAEGYVIDTYEVKTAGGVEITVKDGDFTMPADNVTVTVTFKEYVQPEQGDTIDYVMPFAANASGNSSTTVDGTVINTTGNYTLFDNYVQLQNMGFSNAHGLSGTGPIVVQVPGPVDITVGTCVYDDFKLVVKDSANNVVGEVDDIVGSSQPLTAGGNGTYGCYESNGSKVVVSYEGEATTLTISFESSTNGASANARFWLPYLRVNSTQAAGKYSDWKVGQAGENNTDGNIEVVEYEGKESLFVRKRNAYTTLDEAVSTGKVEFTTSVWIDPATSIFRIYLENENGSNYQDNKNTKSAVFAEVINNTSSGTLCVGPALGSSTVAGDSLAGTAAGWYDIKIALDYDKADTNEFITVTVNNAAGEQVLNQSMAAIDGIDKNLKQIRLIARGDDVAYFADMQVTIGGETPVPTATATAAPATPAPTATATAAPATATPTNVPAEPVTASYTAPASGTTLAANATLIKNDGVDMYTTGAVTVAENVDSNYDTATYKSRIPFRGNATIKAHIDDINNANIKADNTSVVIKAIQSGTFTAKVGIDKTKTMRLWDNTDDKEVHSVTPDVKAVTTFEYDLIAGHDYLFYASGTSANLYSVEYTYTPGEAVVPTPPATEEPTATPVPTATATPDQPQYEATLSYDGGEAQNGTFEELLAAIPANAANAVITLHKDVVIADGSDQIEIKSSVKVTSDAATGVTVTQGKCIKIPGGAAITLDGNITFKGTSSATSGYGRKHMFAITGANGKFIANSGVTLDYSEAETADEFSIVRTDWNGSGQEIQINGATVNGGSAYLNYTNSNNEDITKITGAAAVNAKVHAGYIKEEGSHTVIDLDGYTGDPINVELYTTTKNTAGLVIAKNVSDISKINLAENNAWDVELSGTDVVLKAKGIPVEISIPETKTTYEGGEAALSSTVVNTGETITVTETAYYGFEAQTPECKAVTASGETPVTVSGADGVYTFTGIEGAEKYIVTPKFAQKDTTKAILYLGDSTVANNSGQRIQMDKDIKLMNYVKDGAAATWESAEVPSDVSSAKVVSTISGKPAVTLTVNQASGDRTDITSDAAISNFKAAGTRFYVSELDLSNISFTASDSVTITVNAADGGTGYLGNYWYIIFE